MGNSIFQNFSVEYLYSSATPDVGLGETPHLFLLLFEALAYCGKLEVDEDRKLKGARQATDESLTALAENVNELANFALENETEIYWAGFASKSKKVDECSVFALAFAGLICGPKCSVSHAQISGIAALWLLDNAIIRRDRHSLRRYHCKRVSSKYAISGRSNFGLGYYSTDMRTLD
jgi:hypothetical protein